jgi:outer membrane protein TolC
MRGVARLGVVLLLGALLLLAGCAAPDEWESLRPDFEGSMPVAPPDRPAPPTDPPAPPAGSALLPGAEGVLALSEEQAVLLAFERNRDLRVERLAPAVAGTFEAIARGAFDPELFAEIEAFREKSEETSRSTGEAFSVRGEELEVTAGVRQDFPTGTSVEGRVEQSLTDSNRSPEQQRARIGLTVTQSLLRGLGPAVNLARVRQARLGAEASVHELRRFAEVLLAETKVAYWNLVLANQEIEIFSNSLELARKQLGELEQRIAVGLLPETEAAAARAEVALREQALIDARSQVEDRRLRLLRLLGGDRAGGLGTTIRPISKPDLAPDTLGDLPDRIELAVTRRPDLEEARLRLRQGRLETIVTRNGLLPRLEVFMTLAPTGFGDTFVGSFRELEGDTYDVTVGVRLEHILGNRAAEARDRAAWLETRQAARAIENLEQLVRLEVRLAANEVERARQQIAASRTTRELQERTAAAERERFDVGTSTALLVAQAERDLLATRIREVEAVVAYRIALVALHLAEGSLLARHGISIDR